MKPTAIARSSKNGAAPRRWLTARAAVVWASLALVGAGTGSPALAWAQESAGDPHGHAPGEAMLEGRLIAPCCWTQTLDIHESGLATELRTEIHDRLIRGEMADAIEDDLVARYGERIRAVPKGGRDPRAAISIGGSLIMLVSAIGVLWLVRSWTRRRPAGKSPFAPTPAAATSGAGPAGRDEYDDRLEDELRKLDT